MNVFVTGTGRCGTSTFYQACRHFTNYTTGHESHAGFQEVPYPPDNHIEVSSQLVIWIPRLLRFYPDAKFVHLIRERRSCVKSLAYQALKPMKDFASQWFQYFPENENEIPLKGAMLFYESMNDLIPALVPASQLMTIQIETAQDQWETFCRWINAEGDLEEGAKKLLQQYNTKYCRGVDNFIGGGNGNH